MQLPKRGQGEKYDIVFWVIAACEGTLPFLGDSNDGEQLAVNIDFLSESASVREQFVGRVMAQHDNGRMTLIVTLIPPAAFGHSEIEYFGPFPGIAFEHGVLSPAVAIFHHVGAGTEFWSLVAKPRSDRFHMCQVLHGQAVFESQFLASPHFFGGPSDL